MLASRAAREPADSLLGRRLACRNTTAAATALAQRRVRYRKRRGFRDGGMRQQNVLHLLRERSSPHPD